MKAATVALVVRFDNDAPSLVDLLSDDREIYALESAVQIGEVNPLEKVYEFREKQDREDSEFGDYVEDLLSKPFLRSEIQDHAVQWLKSKIRIEDYKKTEIEAARIIAEYAYKVFLADLNKTDFFLAGPKNKVRVRVFVLSKNKESPIAA